MEINFWCSHCGKHVQGDGISFFSPFPFLRQRFNHDLVLHLQNSISETLFNMNKLALLRAFCFTELLMGNFKFLISSDCDDFYKSCLLQASNKQENKGNKQSEKGHCLWCHFKDVCP